MTTTMTDKAQFLSTTKDTLRDMLRGACLAHEGQMTWNISNYSDEQQEAFLKEFMVVKGGRFTVMIDGQPSIWRFYPDHSLWVCTLAADDEVERRGHLRALMIRKQERINQIEAEYHDEIEEHMAYIRQCEAHRVEMARGPLDDGDLIEVTKEKYFSIGERHVVLEKGFYLVTNTINPYNTYLRQFSTKTRKLGTERRVYKLTKDVYTLITSEAGNDIEGLLQAFGKID